MNPPGIGITQAFASPIIHSFMPDSEPLNRRLRELFLQWERDPGQKRSSVPTQVPKVAVYESSFDLFHKTQPEIQHLAQFCLQNLGYVIAQLNGYSAEDMAGLRIFHHSWYHLTRREGYTAQHNHPMASWSGVYCVDPGDTLPERPNNGALRFLESRSTASMYLDPGNCRSTRTLWLRGYRLRAEARPAIVVPLLPAPRSNALPWRAGTHHRGVQRLGALRG